MPRLTPPQELDKLAECINATPAEVSIETLLQQPPGNTMPRRTLQRRLSLLVEQQRIAMHGKGRATRYHRLPLPSKPTQQSPTTAPAVAATAASTADYVPTSAEGANIRAAISQPRDLRKPVGYQLEFLSQYHPTTRPTYRPHCESNCTPWAAPQPNRPPQAPSPKTSSTAC